MQMWMPTWMPRWCNSSSWISSSKSSSLQLNRGSLIQKETYTVLCQAWLRTDRALKAYRAIYIHLNLIITRLSGSKHRTLLVEQTVLTTIFNTDGTPCTGKLFCFTMNALYLYLCILYVCLIAMICILPLKSS